MIAVRARQRYALLLFVIITLLMQCLCRPIIVSKLNGTTIHLLPAVNETELLSITTTLTTWIPSVFHTGVNACQEKCTNVKCNDVSYCKKTIRDKCDCCSICIRELNETCGTNIGICEQPLVCHSNEIDNNTAGICIGKR